MDEIIELENYIQERLKDESLPDYRREQYELDLMDVKRVEQEKRSQISDVYTEGETVLELRDEEYFEGKPLKSKPIVMEMSIWKLTLMGRKSRFMLITSTKSRKYLLYRV